MGEQLRGELETMRAELAAGRRKGLAGESVARLFADAPRTGAEPPAARPPVLGERVRHRGLGWEGVLRGLEGDAAEVAVAGKRLRCSAEELVPLAEPAAGEGSAPAGATVVAGGAEPPPGELKLIGQRVEPALDELDLYLDVVRVVHGHGSGRLRDAVREHLRDHPAVASHRPGRRREGGDGATVVTLAG